jgi:hypothetical protein
MLHLCKEIRSSWSEHAKANAIRSAAVKGKEWVYVRAYCKVCNGDTAVYHPAQQRVQPTPPLRPFGLEKALVIQPVLSRTVVALRWRG